VHLPAARASPVTAGQAASLAARIDALGGLRELVALPGDHDLASAQWDAILAPLRRLQRTLRARLAAALTARGAAVADRLGTVELEVGAAFGAFDTFADVLTQRAAPRLGRELAGCDALADDALRRPDPRLAALAPPLVYCDRGLGAAILRQGVHAGGEVICPIPLIQIPYARLVDKLTLTSILHEVGHQALAALGIGDELARAVGELATGHTAVDLARWAPEIGADLWSFLCAGPAHAYAAVELFALPHAVALARGRGPHPPPALRVELALAWCQATWPRGPWAALAGRWRARFDALPGAAATLAAVRRLAPPLARATLSARFATLDHQPLTRLFDLAALAPARLATLGGAAFAAARPCVQLAALRVAATETPSAAVARRATDWLSSLRSRRCDRPLSPGGFRCLI